MTQLHKLNSGIHSIQDQTLSQRILFHHLRITAISIITPNDRTLKITLDNTINTLTPPRTESVATPHHLHLYLNPHNRLPCLQHTCNGTEKNPTTLLSLIRSIQDQTLSQRILFHHLRITAISIITPNDRTLKITLDNTIHTLTPPRTGSVAIPHHLHLYLNPHNRLPYLQHTCNGTGKKSNHVIVTTSLRCHQYESTNARRRPMLRTTSHAPDFITTLTFPVDSIHHQQSILTLVTHMLLTVPIVTPQQSWNIIREKDSHRYTLQLILATITLKRHYIIWHTVQDHSPTTQPTSHQPTEHLSTRPTRRNTLPQRHQHPKPQRHTGS